MKPLHVAVIVKDRPGTRERDQRNMGMWSYEVEQFTWDFIAPGKGKTLDTRQLRDDGFDLIFHEDGGAWADYKGHALPIVFYSIDSTLTDEYHYTPRFAQACQADLVCVDHDDLARFEQSGRPVRRLLYCVNDRVFYPREKTLDVDFQCGSSPERARLRVQLADLCKAQGWSYKSGVSALDDYAANMGAAKVVVVQPRTKRNRPHRVYDAMASGAAVLAAQLPEISGEGLDLGFHYSGFDDFTLKQQLQMLLERNVWPEYAAPGQGFAALNTWNVRAKELREMLRCELSV